MDDIVLSYAEIDQDNSVKTIGIISKKNATDDSFAEKFLQYHYKSTNRWIRCWQDADKSVEKRYAYPGIDTTYDPDLDIFYGSQPYPGWTFDTTILEWVPPAGAPEKLILTDEQVSQNYEVRWDYRLWDKGEYPWRAIRIPTEDPPQLTSDQIDAGCSYLFDESIGEWIFITPSLPKPNLTDDQITNSCNYFWDQTLYEEDNTKSWVLVCSHV